MNVRNHFEQNFKNIKDFFLIEFKPISDKEIQHDNQSETRKKEGSESSKKHQQR